MKTKEKIREFLIEEIFGSVAKDDHIELPNGASLREIIDEDVPEMMDEYAEQMAIGFHNWKEEHFAGVDGVTTKELYQLYLKSIEK